MKCRTFLISIALTLPINSFAADREVVVDKPTRTLWLVEDNKVVDSFPISLGDQPVGHKVQVGDERTPEGSYLLTSKLRASKFYRSIHINYPNEDDRRRAKALGVHPGGNIKIHGLPNDTKFDAKAYEGVDWTDGCIAVSNEAMDTIWKFTTPGTPIQINGNMFSLSSVE